MDPGSGFRIHFFEFSMHSFPSTFCGQRFDLLANPRARIRHRSEAIPQDLEIEHRAPDQNRRFASHQCV